MRRFSKLKKRIEELFSPDLDMEVHCTVYRKKTSRTILKLPRLWITLNGEIIFDFIKDFKGVRASHLVHYIDNTSAMVDFPIIHLDILFITDMIQEYIETPVNKLLDHVLSKDYYGLSDILKAADRRIGKQRLLLLRDRTENEAAKKIIDTRLANKIKSKH